VKFIVFEFKVERGFPSSVTTKIRKTADSFPVISRSIPFPSLIPKVFFHPSEAVLPMVRSVASTHQKQPFQSSERKKVF
jgi:hypothetical protein